MYRFLTISIFLVLPFSVAGLTLIEVPYQERASRHISVHMEDILERVEQSRSKAREYREEIISSSIEERRSMIDSHRESLREEATSRIESALEESKRIREANMERVEQYRVGISEEVRSKINEALEERVNNMGRSINMINMRLSSSYMNILNQMERLIDKAEERTEKIEEISGSDMTDVYEKLMEARREIDIARDEVLLQEGSLYEISFDSFEGMGNSFSEAIQMIKDDHQNIRKEIIGNIQSKVREANTLLQDSLN